MSNTFLRQLRAGVCISVFNFLVFSSSALLAMPAAPFPFSETQPDGLEITLHLRGDENYNWMEDTDGYTVVKNKGWFEYAVQAPSGHLNPNGMVVGRANPKAAGLEKHIKPTAAIRALSAKKVNGVSVTSEGVSAEGVAPAGTVKNLVVMVRFSNHVGRTLPSVADVDVLFNATGGHPTLAPTGSVKDVYFENSYGQMTLNSVVNPGIGNWITVSNTEAYYANGQSGDSTLWLALREALTALDNAGVNFKDYDTDNDGRIDSIAFIHSGYGAEWGGNDAYGATSPNRIWSHRWAIQPQWNSNDGVSVFDYHISPGVWGTSGSAIGRIGVIAHETGHFFGLPDLYDTEGTGEGVGSWELMANSWDFNFTQLCPPHFSPWSKSFLGWYTPAVISQSGQYTINQAETNPQAYRINSGFSSGEYLLIENRQNAGFDCTIPQGGVAIWHIDDNTGYNAEGYPGQANWPANGNHYRVALLQADGNYNLEKGNNRGDSGDMHRAGGVDAIAPGPGIYPNTDTYKGGVITQTGITISNISASSASMTFCLNGCTGVPAPSGLAATAQSTSAIALNWTDNSSTETGFTIESSINGSTGWAVLANVGANVTSYSNGGLSPNTTRFYHVRAFTGTGTSTWSNTASATTIDVPPAAPTPMSASAFSSSQINLAWADNANNETGYRVERSLTGSSGWTTVATLGANSTSRSDTGLAASTPYFYRVAAFNSAGDSGFASANATTTAPPLFYDYVAQAQSTSEGTVSGSYTNTQIDDDVVQSITEVQLGGNPSKRRSSLNHRWTFNVTAGNATTLTANAWLNAASTDGDSFQFQYSTDGVSYTNAFLVSSTSSGNQASFILPNTLTGTVYVQVIDTNDVAGNSAVDRINVDYLVIHVDNTVVTPPAAPTLQSATAVTYNQVNLVWTDNATDETAYEVQRATGGGSYSTVATLGANVGSYSDTSVSASTTYNYKVRALKGATPSSFSDVRTATTPSQPSGTINLSANGFKVKAAQQVDLSWTGATTAVDIKRSGTSTKIVTAEPNDGFYNDNIGAKGTATYQYQVCNTGGGTCSNTVIVVF